MSKQRNRGWSRREFLDAAAVAGTGALLGLRSEAIAEGAARQTKIRIYELPSYSPRISQ